MNKRYIDFVPAAKKTAVSASKKNATVEMPAPQKKPVRAGVRRMEPVRRVGTVSGVRRVDSVRRVSPTVKPKVAKTAEVASKVKRTEPVRRIEPAEKAAPVKVKARTFTDEKKPKTGDLEDLSRHFVKTEVKKRPLSQPSPRFKHSLRDKISGKQAKAKQKEAEIQKASEKTPEEKLKETYKMPNSPFINQANIEKRPLSKTVYTKKVVVPKEEKQEPVTIISKPEKQSHVGIVVAVILTIILGAAAGTAAFLLLPK